MSLDLKHLPDQVAKPLRSFYRRQRLLRLLRVLLTSAAVYGVLLLVAVHVDRFWFLDLATRQMLFWFVHGATGIFFLISLTIHLWRRPSLTRIAYEIEAALPGDAEERLVTLNDVRSHEIPDDNPVARQLIAELEDKTLALAKDLRGARLVRDRGIYWAIGVFVLVAVCCGALMVPKVYEFDLMLKRFYQPQANLNKPSFVKLAIRNPAMTIGKGEEVVIQAEITNNVPDWAKWMLKRLGMPPNRCLIAFAPGADTRFNLEDLEPEVMSRVDRKLFLYTRANMQETTSYKIRCGDAETQVHTITVVTQPRVEDLVLTAKSPEYAKLPKETITDFGKPLRFLPDTTITVRFNTDQKTRKQELRFAGRQEAVEPEVDEETGDFLYEFTLKKKTAFEIFLVNEQGFRNVERRRVTISVYQDARPSVRLVEPSTDLRLVPAELVPVDAQLEDDLGLQELSIVYLVNPDPSAAVAPDEKTVELPKDTQTKAEVSTVFSLEQVDVGPGDLIQLWLRAKDSAGNYGESRKVNIEIVAFTRGENERRRLAHLRFAVEAMRMIQQLPPPKEPPADGTQTPAVLMARLMKQAEENDLSWPAGSSMQVFLTLLQNEVFFTDASTHKQDLRMIAGLLQGAVRSVDPQVTDPIARRNRTLKLLSEEILPPMIRYRQLKNIIWRYYGLRYEAESIMAKIDMMKEGDPSKDQLKSLIKRAELYLDSLEDLGEELSVMARETDLLDLKAIQEQLVEMNSRGYYMRMGRPSRSSLTRRRNSAETVFAQINVMLDRMKPKLLPMARQAAAARTKLETAYSDQLQMAGVPAVRASPEHFQRLTAWLRQDLDLMTWDPFLPFWPRFRDYALLRLTAAAPPAQVTAILTPVDELAQLRDQNARRQRRLQFDWQAQTLANADGLSAAERVLALTLLELEEMMLSGKKPDAAVERLAAFKPSAEPTVAAADLLALRTSRWGGADQQELEGTLLTKAQELQPFLAPDAELDRRLELLQAHHTALRELLELNTDDPGAVREASAGPIYAAMADAVVFNEVCQALVLRLYDPALKGDAKAELDQILLALREQRDRVRVRFMIYLRDARLIKPGQLDTQNVEAFMQELDQFIRLHQWTLARVQSLLEQMRAEDNTRPKKSYSAIADLARVSVRRRALEQLLAGTDRQTVAANFVKAVPAAAATYVYANRQPLAEAFITMTRADALLKGESPKIVEFNKLLDQVKTKLNRMLQIVRQTGEGELQGRLIGVLAEQNSRVGRLQLPNDAAAAQISRTRFELNTVVKELDRVNADVQDLVNQQDAVRGLKAAPDTARDLKRDREVAIDRLHNQLRMARRQQTLAILAAFDPQTPEAVFHQGLAWAYWEERLIRSDLNAVTTSGAGSGAQTTVKLSLQKWLMKQNEEAQENIQSLQNYKAVQKRYHDIAGDLLRH